MAFLEFRKFQKWEFEAKRQDGAAGETWLHRRMPYPILSPCLDAPDPTGFAQVSHPSSDPNLRLSRLVFWNVALGRICWQKSMQVLSAACAITWIMNPITSPPGHIGRSTGSESQEMLV